MKKWLKSKIYDPYKMHTTHYLQKESSISAKETKSNWNAKRAFGIRKMCFPNAHSVDKRVSTETIF